MDCTRRGALASGLALAVGGCIELGGASGGDWPDTDWPTVAYDERNRGAVGDGGTPNSLSEAWAEQIGAATSAPVAADGTVYLANRDHLRAVSIESGGSKWFAFQAAVSGTPALDDGAFVPTTSEDGGALVRLDPDDEVDWRRSLAGGRPHAPVLDDDAIAVRTNEATVLVDRGTTEAAWTREEPTFETHTRFDFVDMSPALAGDSVVVPGPDGVRCRDRATGDQRWHYSGDRVTSSPAVEDGTVYASLVGDGVVALDLASGEELWSVDASGCWTSPAVGDETVYATAGFDLLAIGRESGDVEWRMDDHGLHGDSFSNPILVGDAVVAGSIGRAVTVVDANDGEVRSTVGGKGTHVSPAIASEHLLVVDGQTLRAYGAE